MALDPNKNKLIIPEPAQADTTSGCPDCGAKDYSGRNVGGVLLRKCRACGREWTGGLPRVPYEPGKPIPPENYKPTVDFGRDSKGEVVEIRRRPDVTPAYRKGARITEDE